MTLTLYTNPQSRGRIARWMLEEVGASYDTVVVDWRAEKPAALLAANPLGKVPTIVHDGRAVTEVAAICAYLAAAFPTAGLMAEGDELAPFYRWLFFTAGPFEAAVIDRALGFEVPADRRVMVGYGSFAEAVDAYEGAVSGRDFVCGDRFTAADVAVASALAFYMRFGWVEPRDVFTAYVARATDRSAFRRATAIDDALAQG